MGSYYKLRGKGTRITTRRKKRLMNVSGGGAGAADPHKTIGLASYISGKRV